MARQPTRPRTLRVAPEGVEIIRAIRRRTPDDRRVILGGKLDSIRHSDRAFTLVLMSGETVKGIAGESVDASTLGALFGKPALVSGVAKFRPSGKVLRLEAERVDPAPPHWGVWSTMPQALDLPVDPGATRAPQVAGQGLAALFGSIPMEEGESEEEFRAAVDLLS